MFYIKGIRNNMFEVVDTRDNVVDLMSYREIEEALKLGIRVEGAFRDFGFSPVVPVSDTSCRYIGSPIDTLYDAVIVPTSSWARQFTKAYDNLGKRPVVDRINPPRMDSSDINRVALYIKDGNYIVKKTGTFLDISTGGLFRVEIDGVATSMFADYRGGGLPIPFKSLFGRWLSDRVSTEFKELFEIGRLRATKMNIKADIKMYLNKFRSYFILYDNNGYDTLIHFPELDLILYMSEINRAREAVMGVGNNVFVAKFSKFRENPDNALYYEVYELLNTIIPTILLGDAMPFKVKVGVGINKGIPMLYYTDDSKFTLQCCSLGDYLLYLGDIPEYLYETGLSQSSDGGTYFLSTVTGNYSIDINLFKYSNNLLVDKTTGKLMMRAKLTGIPDIEMLADGSLTRITQTLDGKILIPEGVTRLCRGSIIVTDQLKYIKFPSTLKEVDTHFIRGIDNNTKINATKFKISYSGDSRKVFETILDTLYSYSATSKLFISHVSLTRLSAFCPKISNMEVVFYCLLSRFEYTVGSCLCNITVYDLAGLDMSKISEAFYLAIVKFCGVPSGNRKITINRSELSKAYKRIRNNEVVKSTTLELYPQYLDSLSINATPANAEYRHYIYAKCVFDRIATVLPEEDRDAIDRIFHQIQLTFDKYLLYYKGQLQQLGIYNANGEFDCCNVAKILNKIK